MRIKPTFRNLLLAMLIFLSASAKATPSSGDYRSNVSPTGLWSDASSWQIYNGTAWIAASSAPTHSNGVITVLAGDSIRMNSATTIDQLIVENGATVIMTNSLFSTTFTLNNGAGNDIENFGHLYISTNGVLSGAGNVVNDSDGILTLRNLGTLGVGTTNIGETNISGTGTIQNSTFTNNRIVNLINGTLNINNASLANNDTVNVSSTLDTYFSGAGTSTFINNTTAVIHKIFNSGTVNFNGTLTLTNTGKIVGTGQFNIGTTATNTGTISLNAVGILELNNALISGKAPTIALALRTTGAVAGANYDHLQFTTILTNTNISNATLNITDLSMDAAGTTYTLFTTGLLGSISGTFASVHLPPTLTNLTYNTNSITVQKSTFFILENKWGSIAAIANKEVIDLHWNTLQEGNKLDFIVERSEDGNLFKAIGKISSLGNNSTGNNYVFTDRVPIPGKINYYRVKAISAEGSSSYSASARAAAQQSDNIKIMENPVREKLHVIVSENGIVMNIIGSNGTNIKRCSLGLGSNEVDLSNLAAGYYITSFFKNSQLIYSKEIIKM